MNILPLLDDGVQVREGVEGTVAGQALHPRQLVELADHEVVAFLEGPEHRCNTGLIPIQRRHGRRLGDRGGIGGALRLDLFHGLDQRFRAPGIADAPAGHGVGLGHAVQHDGAGIQFRAHIEDVAERGLGPEDVFIHVIGGDEYLGKFQQHLGQGGQFLVRVGHARGVGGAVDHEQFGAVGDGGLELSRGDLEVLLDAGIDDHRLAIGQAHHVRIGYPVGRGDDHLVAGIEQRHHQVEEALLATAGHQDLVRGITQAIIALELGDHGIFQCRGAVHGGVLGLPVMDGGNGRFLDVLGRVEVRFTGTQADNILAGGAQFGGTGGYCQGRGGLYAMYALGQG